jgi:hypothetical protein
LGTGIGILVSNIEKSKNWISVMGTITGSSYCGCSSNNNGSYNSCQDEYASVVEYIVDGVTYTFTSNCSSGQPSMGKDFKILYDPADPGEADSGSFVGLWLLPLIFIPIGLSALCLLCITCFKRSSASLPEGDNGFGDSGNNAGYDDGKVEAFPASTYTDPDPQMSSTTPSTYMPEEATPTNPYVTYAEENHVTTNNDANTSKPGKPSLFDQLQNGN